MSSEKHPILGNDTEAPLCQWFRMSNNLKKLREAKGWTHQEAADAFGVSRGHFIKLERGERKLTQDYIQRAAIVFGVPEVDVFSGPTMIPVVGYVGAGAEVFCIDDHAKGAGLDEVDMPIPGMSPSSVAVRVRGDSMIPAYFDGDLIFYDKNDNGDLMHLVGKECVVSLTDGRKFIKTLRRRANGDWYLFSYNAEPIMDIEIEWAAKVNVIKRA